MSEIKEYIKQKLDEIHDKKKGKVTPDHVILTELNNAVIQDIKDTLNDLYKEGEIKVGNTINGKYITRKNWN